MSKIFLLIFCVMLTMISYAQPPDVVVDGKGKREIEPSSRILEFPRIIDTVKSATVSTYPLLVYQKETKIILDTIQIATI